jgi:putative transferase (TIGR04331 family)
MILQTTGGFQHRLPSNNLFALGPWCGSGNTEPSPNGLGLSHESDIDVESVSSQLVLQLESTLYPALNALHNVNLAREVWKFSLGTYLRVLTPLLVTRYNLVQRAISEVNCAAFTDVPVEIERIVPCDRTELQALVNSHAWNHYVFSEICKGLGLAPQSFPDIEPDNDFYWHQPKHHAPHRKEFAKTVVQRACNAVAKRRSIVVTQTLLPSRIEFGVALKHVSLPVFWRGDESYSDKVQMNLRTKLYEALPSSDSFAATLLAIIIQTLPRLFVEDFARIRTTTKTRLPTKPRVVFTSNLHMASDQFLLWLSEVRASGTKVVIGQHGGVHCLARDTPAEAVVEMDLADRYLAWGKFSTHVPRGVSSPILVNVGANQAILDRSAATSRVVMILDSPYRYPSPPRGMNGDRFSYSRIIYPIVDVLQSHGLPQLTLRLHSSAQNVDSPMVSLLGLNPSVVVDDGTRKIEDLYRSARLVITTSIGTTFFQTINHDIPTVMFLDPVLSPLSLWATNVFEPLKDVGILFTEPKQLREHLLRQLPKLEDWWNSGPTTTAREQFLETFTTPVKSPVSFYAHQLSFNSGS